MADGSELIPLRKESGNTEDERLERFLEWCNANNLKLSDKVSVGIQGSCHRYGMVATQDIAPGECLFKIPRHLLLESKNCGISKILSGKVKEKWIDSHERSSWVPLLLALMFEFTDETSFWRPYLDIVPGIEVLDQPMFWPKEDRMQLLKGIGIQEDVQRDLDHIEEQYQNIALPFMKKFRKYLNPEIHNLALYKHMAAFIMAYSFTEDSPGYHSNTPVMVPMADILNHHSNNNARLEFRKEDLAMVSTQHIGKGQEVFNTYGQLANCHLLQSYGFVESTPHPNDTVEVNVDLFCKAVRSNVSTKHEARIADAKFQFMEEMGLVSNNDVIVFTQDGSYSEGPDLRLFLKILHLSNDQLRQLAQQSNQECEELLDIRELLEHCTDQQRCSCLKLLQSVLNIKDSTNCAEASKRKRYRSINHTEASNKKTNLHSSQSSETEVEIKNKKIKSSELPKKGTDKNYDDNVDSDDDGSDDDDDEPCEDRGENGMEDSDDESAGDTSKSDGNISDDNGEDEPSSDDEDMDVRLSYEQMMEFPKTWRVTLQRVAEICKTNQRRLWEGTPLDEKGPVYLNTRERRVLMIRQGQQAIWQKICDLG